MSYTITAGNSSTDLGIVGKAATLYAAKRIGRKAVRESLPDGCGTYRVWIDGQEISAGTKDIHTAFAWIETAN